MTASPRATFTVVYRTGGTKNCEWRRTLAFSTRDLAREAADDCERMGYKALIHRTDHLDSIGMPEGWSA